MADLTVLGLGRDIAFVSEAARRSGMQIIAATGLYTYDEVPRYFEHRDVDHMADLFVLTARRLLQDLPNAHFVCPTTSRATRSPGNATASCAST